MTYNIKLDKVELLEKLIYKASQEPVSVYNFEINTQSVARRDLKIVITFVSVTIKKEGTNEVLASFLVACGFMIENYEDAILKDENERDIIPHDLDNIFKTISISTVRGIIFSELRGTHLHNAYMPIILADQLQPTEKNVLDR